MNAPNSIPFIFEVLLRALTWLIISAVLFSCNSRINNEHIESPGLESITPPACPNTEEPYLFTSASGEVYLSWIEKKPGGMNELRFSGLEENGKWSPFQLIASGKDWFVNWADFSALAVSESGHMIAYFLQLRTNARIPVSRTIMVR